MLWYENEFRPYTESRYIEMNENIPAIIQAGYSGGLCLRSVGWWEGNTSSYTMNKIIIKFKYNKDSCTISGELIQEIII